MEYQGLAGMVPYSCAQALVDEILDTSKLGKRGEGWFLGQLALVLAVLFPQYPLEVCFTPGRNLLYICRRIFYLNLISYHALQR